MDGAFIALFTPQQIGGLFIFLFAFVGGAVLLLLRVKYWYEGVKPFIRQKVHFVAQKASALFRGHARHGH